MEKIFYLASVFEGLNIIGVVVLVISILTTVVGLICYLSERDYFGQEEYELFKKIKTFSITSLIVSALILIFVPSKETYYFMVGGKAIEEVAKNERVQETAGQTLDLLQEYLQAETEKIREKRESKCGGE